MQTVSGCGLLRKEEQKYIAIAILKKLDLRRNILLEILKFEAENMKSLRPSDSGIAKLV